MKNVKRWLKSRLLWLGKALVALGVAHESGAIDLLSVMAAVGIPASRAGAIVAVVGALVMLLRIDTHGPIGAARPKPRKRAAKGEAE